MVSHTHVGTKRARAELAGLRFAVMSAPEPFIQLDSSTGQLRVTDEARALLSKLRGTVAVCAVAGVYRTGKSYILNQLAGRQRVFGVGSSLQACTKGIWMWGAPRKPGCSTPGAPNHLLLLDTEGLASISQTEGHDAKIFCLALLLSSFFVYNSEKAIDSAAIDQLSLVVQLIQKIRVHAEGAAAESQGAAELASFFPNFLWLLRDFQLEPKDQAGRELTPTQYLEECLRAQPGTSAAVAEQNSTRAAITRLFPQRGCIALPHPTLGTALTLTLALALALALTLTLTLTLTRHRAAALRAQEAARARAARARLPRRRAQAQAAGLVLRT